MRRDESFNPDAQSILQVQEAKLPTSNSTTNDTVPVLLPPLESHVRNNKIIGDVSFLLDVAIVGFAKCGTSTLTAWLEQGSNLKSLPGESFALLGNEPSRLATWLWNMKRDNLILSNNVTATTASSSSSSPQTQQYSSRRPPPKQFYKQPKDAYQPHVLQALQQHWPRTKLIYTVRHPVEWFESYWNFRYRNAARKPAIPNTVLGRKGTLSGQLLYEPLHTGLGEFHVYMAMLGKTAQRKNASEWALLKPFLKPNEWGHFPFPPTSHPVFFLDAAQLSDTNTTRLTRLQHDLSHFLDLNLVDKPLSLPIPHVRPEASFLHVSQLHHHYQHRFDICLDAYQTLRAYLVWMGSAASQWLLEYFMASPEVSYSSVDSHLEQLLASWSKDPCSGREKEERRGGGQLLPSLQSVAAVG